MPIAPVEQYKYLSLWLDPSLSINFHIQSVIDKITYRLKLLYQSINCFSFLVRKRIVTQLLLPIFDYSDIIYQNTTGTNLQPLNVLYNSLCRFILRCPFRTRHCLMSQQLQCLTPSSRRQLRWLMFIFKCIHLHCPDYLNQYFSPFTSSHSLRHTTQTFFVVPRIKKEIGKFSFRYKAPFDWNNLPSSIRSITSIHVCKNTLTHHLQNMCNCL